MPMPALDVLGKRFARLVVVGHAENVIGSKLWWAECDCGGRIKVTARRLITGNTRSCGCLLRQSSSRRAVERNARMVRHGDARRKACTDVYIAWQSMRRRCRDKSHAAWKHYGGRGIKVCQLWVESYEAFRDYMGPKPSPAHSLDRIDNDKGYEPGNCRWATKREQILNQRRFKSAAS